jgi:5-methylcytosine-specific restriction endonuclease McrA
MSPTLRQVVTERADARCEYCDYPQCINDGVLHLDHIIPPQLGGTHTADNRALACQHCNLRKRDKIEGADPLTNQAAPLFNPRQQHWDEHFRLERSTGEIIPLTSTGRVTVQELRLNHPDMVRVRIILIQMGLL